MVSMAGSALRTALSMRGLVKLTDITIAVTQILTLVFDALLVAVDYAPETATLPLFRFVTCALVSFGRQADVSRAYRHAAQRGLVTMSGAHGELIDIAPQCPKRWLAVSSLQLEPRWLNGERIK
ncbi:hypothetical protein WL88_20855 [Burkholderia diffusa]|uniref:Uncharacterized protein n=1 Tax=Burkholderia diffusa TaxID=488732 RepID=A0AAW3PCG5_9BURK|nr:hypothetical protein WJ62_09950 [Burkholderia diffusa]KWF28441.1 hypothetical protein WL85_25390 [Burkholderia diffusa]KWF36403.1 hypothetical protein WL86_19235 [Burkholderia diffusa]KWF40562.1 hypothetical protein WL87_28635 [Burkholderia diffusa]KWF50110.1 hypothetical protein WL88_20855 [Burkholderia diffusa]